MTHLDGVDVERMAEHFRNQALASDLEHSIELRPLNLDTLVLDREDAGAGVQELHEVFLSFDGVVRSVSSSRFSGMRVTRVFDREFVKHNG